jgi:hypothetical protein
MIERIEEALNVHLQHPTSSHLHESLPELAQRHVCRATRTATVRTGQEVLLENRLQHHGHRSLKYLVLEAGYANRPGLRPVALGHVGATHGWSLVATRLEPLEQRAEVGLELRLVVLPRLAVHSQSAVLACATERLLQDLHVDVMG